MHLFCTGWKQVEATTFLLGGTQEEVTNYKGHSENKASYLFPRKLEEIHRAK